MIAWLIDPQWRVAVLRSLTTLTGYLWLSTKRKQREFFRNVKEFEYFQKHMYIFRNCLNWYWSLFYFYFIRIESIKSTGFFFSILNFFEFLWGEFGEVTKDLECSVPFVSQPGHAGWTCTRTDSHVIVSYLNQNTHFVMFSWRRWPL